MDRESGQNIASADNGIDRRDTRDCCGGRRRDSERFLNRPRHRRERLSRIGHRGRAPSPRPRCPRAGAAIEPAHQSQPADSVYEGDLLDRASIGGGAGKASISRFTLAADYRLWARDPGAIIRTNVEGTRHDACRARRRRRTHRVHEQRCHPARRRPGGSTEDMPSPRRGRSAPTSAARSLPKGWWRG